MTALPKYRIGDLIGKGGFGEVRELFDLHTRVKYAVKLPRYNDTINRDTILEISALSLFKESRNVIKLHDLYYTGGISPGIVLYLYTNNARKLPPKTPDELKSFAFDVINGLLSLHNKFIYHLDIKPENILYDNNPKYGPYGRYFISDFGISTKNIIPQTGGCLVQSAWYRAPEIVIAAACDKKCTYDYKVDIWSFGIMFGELGMKLNDPKWIHPITYADVLSREREPRRSYKRENLVILTSIYNTFGFGPIDINLDGCARVDITEANPHETFKDLTEIEYDFMMFILKLNPHIRPNYREIFAHPYFNGFIASEPFDLTSLAKVKTLDTMRIRELTFANQSFITPLYRIDILNELKDLSLKHNVFRSYFLASMILDQYIAVTPNIKYGALNPILIAALIASTYINSPEPLRIDVLTNEMYTVIEIENRIVQLFKLFRYNLYFSTEYDYVQIITDPTYQNQVLDYITTAIKNIKYRSYPKEVIVHAITALVTGNDTEIDYTELYNEIGL